MTLPKKLGKDLLIDAVFDMRFKAKVPASNILPGLVFTKFPGDKTLERLPTAELPELMLKSVDPNLRYAPLIRIHWDNFYVLSGNQSAGLSCKLPYPGWTTTFKPAILKLAHLLGEAPIVDMVERFSLKYTNMIPSEHGNAPTTVEFALKVGSHDAAGTLFQIRTELRKGNLVSVVQIAAEGQATLADGTSRKGVVIDIDTIALNINKPFDAFFAELPDELEVAHSEAKAIFFDCLKPDVLAKLEPVYD
jgi:uncharacterized protein (TIGR04255 family)